MWVVIREVGLLREFYVSGQMPNATWSSKLSDARKFAARPSVPVSGVTSVRIRPVRVEDVREHNPARKRRGPRKGVTPPHLRKYLFKKGHR
jgi:hypothetical protein